MAGMSEHKDKRNPTEPYESAHDWNRRYPPGTLVRVDLKGGESFVAETADYAQQWGTLAIVMLRNRPGLWSSGALRPLPHDP